MIKYKIYLKNPASHYIYVDLFIDSITSDTITLQLPAWRPGRYELGNFAKNIKRVDVFDEKGTSLNYSKQSKDKWVLQTKGVSSLKVTYSYYAAELNAGSCYADGSQIYVNPVHMCMYVPERVNESHAIELEIPEAYKIATSLRVNGKTLTASSFDELADSPFIASASLKTDFYEVNGIKFYLHFNGECKPDLNKIKDDFTAFTKAQIDFWGDFPVNEYHFLFQVLPFRFYHGVEHCKNTVIALGPGYSLNQGKMYEDLVGVSSHELFHTWNVKFIRPAEMLPYDFSKENYARTGYVYEGFTTYYGDVMLRKSNVFNDRQYFETFEERLQKHFHNYGRFNLSVAQSSWETWLDGYVPGAPYRKTSIYDEGNLVAFMLDISIMKYSANKNSLKDVCRDLYAMAKSNKGYTEEDIVRLCETYGDPAIKRIFDSFVYGTEDFEPVLKECFDYVGIDLKKAPSSLLNESKFGFKVVDQPPFVKVSLVAPYSPAWKAGLATQDEIVSVNGYIVRNDLNHWLTYFNGSDIEMNVNSGGRIKTVTMKGAQSTFFDSYSIDLATNITDEQKRNYQAWLL